MRPKGLCWKSLCWEFPVCLNWNRELAETFGVLENGRFCVLTVRCLAQNVPPKIPFRTNTKITSRGYPCFLNFCVFASRCCFFQIASKDSQGKLKFHGACSSTLGGDDDFAEIARANVRFNFSLCCLHEQQQVNGV